MKRHEKAASRSAAIPSPPAAAAAGSLPLPSIPPLVSLQLRGLVALPVPPLPLSLLPPGAPGQLGYQDEETLESIFGLSSGPAPLPICEPPLPSASWDEDKEAKERDTHVRPRRRRATNTRPIPSHKAAIKQGQRPQDYTLSSSSSALAPAGGGGAGSAHASIPCPSPPMPPFPAPPPLFRPVSPSPLPSTGRPPFQRGGDGQEGQETDGEIRKRDVSPAVSRYEQVDGETQGGMRGEGHPLVMESDLNFLIDFFENECETVREAGRQ